MFNAKKYLKLQQLEETLGGVGAFDRPYDDRYDDDFESIENKKNQMLLSILDSLKKR